MNKALIFLFGATGDLARKKLLLAIGNLYAEGYISSDSQLICISRRNFTTKEFIDFANINNNPIVSIVKYIKMDFQNPDPIELIDIKNKFSKENDSFVQLSYLAVSPDYFLQMVDVLKKLDHEEHRIVFEKPFGKDLSHAKELNEKVQENFPEEKIFRIDHYLGKELVQNIFNVRFGNRLFEAIWCRQYIDSIQITVAESTGVEKRGSYYETAGATKDMYQNHLLQILSLVCMEPPLDMNPESIRDRKTELLRQIRKIDNKDVVFSQYDEGFIDLEPVNSYCQEDNVYEGSKTETYTATAVFVDNERWMGVPIFLRTGKRLATRVAEINIILKKPESKVLHSLLGEGNENIITIRIQPSEGISVSFMVKEPGPEMKLEKGHISFCYPCLFAFNTMEAYELALLEALNGDHTLFTRWDFVETSWEITQQILSFLPEQIMEFPDYKAGTDGPARAEKLISRYGRKWLPLLPTIVES
ncbi:glucose-6-phosphate dehydrogenase [Myxococcota bacterium]|nr:glucose-6-phosphate dehydrogenase [Myxococcota bacterium]MBU1381921.1 glucose-6-phosphate dehydrogenase [Myxococcota bacterium]MBU1497822.1 glucose-6-phosphate dehydrogenase [Myxococcota bacterium]